MTTPNPPGCDDVLRLAWEHEELRVPCRNWNEFTACPGSGKLPVRKDIRTARGPCAYCGQTFAVKRTGGLYSHKAHSHQDCCQGRQWTLKPKAEWLGVLTDIAFENKYAFMLWMDEDGAKCRLFPSAYETLDDILGVNGGAALAAALVAAEEMKNGLE